MKAKVLTVFSLLLLATVYGEENQEDFAPPSASIAIPLRVSKAGIPVRPMKLPAIPDSLCYKEYNAAQDLSKVEKMNKLNECLKSANKKEVKPEKGNLNQILKNRLQSTQKLVEDDIEDPELAFDNGDDLDYAPPSATNGARQPTKTLTVGAKPNQKTGDSPTFIVPASAFKQSSSSNTNKKSNNNAKKGISPPSSKKKTLVEEDIEEPELAFDNGDNLDYAPTSATNGARRQSKDLSIRMKPFNFKEKPVSMKSKKDVNGGVSPQSSNVKKLVEEDIEDPETELFNEASSLDKREFFKAPSATITKPGATPAKNWNNKPYNGRDDINKDAIIVTKPPAAKPQTNRGFVSSGEDEFLVDEDDEGDFDLGEGENEYYAPPSATKTTSSPPTTQKTKSVGTWANAPFVRGNPKPFFKECKSKALPICSTITIKSEVTEREYNNCKANCKRN